MPSPLSSPLSICLKALLCVAVVLASVASAGEGASAQALSFTACRSAGAFSCATLAVPLDRSGQVPGTVALSVERLQSGSSPSQSAVLALAGGPGQAALPLVQSTAKLLAPALSTRDLLVFDQRGTGSSGPLGCRALESAPTPGSVGESFERCALEIGPARGAYTTQESVADIEALREAAGYRKLVLFGVSYGTKVALEYAEHYPQDVEALVLDSVVPPERDDPFGLATFAAMKPMFEELCSDAACAGISSNPLEEVARLDAALHKHALSGYVFDGAGHRRRATMSSVALLDLIDAGDLNPALRALLPASVHSALDGDPQPLLRLDLLSEGLIPNLPGTPLAGSGDVDEALFADTTCEEGAFPWQRSAPPQTRTAEGLAALRATPPAAFYPFDASTAWVDSVLPGCVQWPNLAAPPPAISPLPSVPTLLLSGAQDLRTPTSGAQAVAARIPGAQLVVVPYTGHSVLGTDFTGCARQALSSFFSSETASQCPPTRNPFDPTPITPTKLALVRPVGGVAGRAGSTLAVVLETILDLERQVVGATLQADQELPSGSSFGGLRGGYARITSSTLSLHRLSLVSGVQISGSFSVAHGRLLPATLRVEGPTAASGSVRVGSSSRVSGTLGGRRFDVDLAKIKLAGAARHAPTATRALDGPTWPGAAWGTRFAYPALARLP